MDSETALLLILSGGAWLAVFIVALALFMRWAKKEQGEKKRATSETPEASAPSSSPHPPAH